MKKVKKMITALATSILVLGCNKYRKNYLCSECKNFFTFYEGFDLYPYCPYCGAKMDKKEENNA